MSLQANRVVSFSDSKEAQFWRALKLGDGGRRVASSSEYTFPDLEGYGGYWKRMIEDPEHKERGACIRFESQVTLRLDDEVIGTSAHAVKPKCRAMGALGSSRVFSYPLVPE